MKFINIISRITKVVLAAAFVFFTAFVSSAQVPEGLSIDNDFAEGEDGYYYVNMLGGFDSEKTITLPEGFSSSFKVYDDGGKNKYYSNNCESKLILTAPTGYVLQLSGDITTELISDRLTVYDGNDKKDGKELLNGVSSASNGLLCAIPTIISSGNSMTLFFYAGSVNNYAGLDLTVKLIEHTDHNIIVNNAIGGSVVCNKTKAKPGEIVTLSIGNQSNGYMLSDINIVYGDNEIVPFNWDGMNDNDVTFRMPTDAVTITPIFTNNFVADNGLFLNMPSSGSKSFSIPTNVKSFKVYDNGGKYNNYSNNYNGLLTLTAPSGYVLQLFATVTTESDYDYLTVYDGNNNSATELLKKAGSSGWGNETTFSPIVSSGQSMTITFSSDDSGICEGLDLTVIVAQPNSSPTSYIIRFNKNSDEAFGTMPVQTHKYNATSALTANSFERIGYAFVGWSTTASGNVEYADKATVTNLATENVPFVELFAKWKITLTNSGIPDIPAQTYTGSAIEPIIVKDGNKTLVQGTDYTVAYSNNINVGTATATITGIGNYAGTVEKTFTISAKALTAANVSDLSAQTYTGSAIEPEIVCDGITLVKGTDYEVSYSDNTYVGTAKATITGKGNYIGTVEKTFTITPKVTNLGALTITEDQNGATATFDASSSETITITEPIEVKTVIIKRAFTAERPSTMILPFQCDASKFGGTFHTVSSVEYNETTHQWEAKASASVATMQANTPYLFKPSQNTSAENPIVINAAEGETISLVANNSEDPYTNAGKKDGSDEDSEWQLVGVYCKKTWAEDSKTEYGFSAVDVEEDGIAAGEFVRAGSGAWMNPMRCYLRYTGTDARFMSKSAPVLPQTIRVIFPDETASVVDPTIPEPSSDITTPVSEIAPNSGTRVWSYDKKIVIESNAGDQYRIIDLSGRTLQESSLAADREEITLSSKTNGIVIVVINGKTFKVNY